MTRAEFERGPVEIHNDGMPYKPGAQPNCKTCNGMGIIDIGENYGAVFEMCPGCWKGKP